MRENQVPPENVRAFAILYSIENSIRELIIEELARVSGPHWFKQRLPGDVLEKFREGVRLERKVSWVQLVPHHPIYYIDFPDLRKIIQRADNWSDCFKAIFRSEEVLEGTLFEIEVIRNRVAHNRRLAVQDVEIVAAARTKLAAALGEERFVSLADRCTHLPSLAESMRRLLEALEESYNSCRRFEVCTSSSEWRALLAQWWFDQSYLGTPTENIQAFFDLISEYNALSRLRGEGYKLERWMAGSGIDERYLRAKEALSRFT